MIVFRAPRVRVLVLSLLVAALAPAGLRAASYVVPPDRKIVKDAEAIVVGSALASRTELTDDDAIVTITTFSLEEIIRGNFPGTTIEIVEPGGVHEDRAHIIPGVPRFEDGERYLLFLIRPETRWMVRDLALGKFSFASDANGRFVAVRDEDEMIAWTPEGKPHQEQRREAEPFLEFVRAASKGGPAREEYYVPKVPLISQSVEARSRKGLLKVGHGLSATSYTTDMGGGAAARWDFSSPKTFFSLGANAAAQTAFTTAINSWNNHASSAISLADGGADDGTHTAGAFASDNVSVVWFEQNMAAKYGAPTFNCGGSSYSGTLGIGAVTKMSAGTTPGPNGEPFHTAQEGDVEMNLGTATCAFFIGLGDFKSAVAHELGHAIGLRHSDTARDNSSACVSGECSNTAIMKAFITGGLNGNLATYDQNAAAAVYPNVAVPAAPTNVVATATSNTSVSVSWTTVSGATSYEIFRRVGGGSFVSRGTIVSPPFVDAASASTAYLYMVRAVNSGGSSPDSTPDLATTVIFTDDPLVVTTTLIKALHLSQLRTATDAVRVLAGLAAGSYTDAASAGVVVKAIHVTEMRTQLDAALGPLGRPTGGYTDGSLGGVLVKAVHFQELRNRVK